MTPSKSKYKPEFHDRRKFDLDKFRSWLRLSTDELKEVAAAFAEKLNQATGPVKVLIPLKGWSGVDIPGNPTFDSEEDRVFVEELQEMLRPDIEIIRVDANMEDPEFAGVVVRVATEVL